MSKVDIYGFVLFFYQLYWSHKLYIYRNKRNKKKGPNGIARTERKSHARRTPETKRKNIYPIKKLKFSFNNLSMIEFR